jgi:CII-binding regulator of phage lambda lysogenization HflD
MAAVDLKSEVNRYENELLKIKKELSDIEFIEEDLLQTIKNLDRQKKNLKM